MSRPTIAIIGASTNPAKFGNRAVRAYRAAGYDVYPVNPHAHEVDGLKAYPSIDLVPLDKFDRVSLYVPPRIGVAVLDQVARKQVTELWLNPGADAPEVVERALELGLNVIQACSLLALEDE